MVTGLPETRPIPVQELAVLVGKHIDAIADMSANLLGDTAPTCVMIFIPMASY